MLTDACDRNPMLTAAPPPPPVNSNSVDSFFVRIVSDGASENDDRLSPEFVSQPA